MLGIGAGPRIDHVQRLGLAELLGDLVAQAGEVLRRQPAFTSPHQIRFSDPGSRTTNLSFGERPVCTPVSTTSGPPSANTPVAPRQRVRYTAKPSSGCGTHAPRNQPRARTDRAGPRRPSPSCGPDGTQFRVRSGGGAGQICQSPPRSTGTRSPAAVMPVTSSSGEPIMKSTWVALTVGAGAVGLVLEHEGIRAAEGDVARGVLVDQRVVEDRAERADPALAVDERELAEPGRARRRSRTCALRAAPFSSASISTAWPPSKRTRRPRMIVPSLSTSGLVDVTWPSVRTGSGVVKTSSVGRFGKWRQPVDAC